MYTTGPSATDAPGPDAAARRPLPACTRGRPQFFDAARQLGTRRGRRAGDLAAVVADMGLDPEVVLDQKWASLSVSLSRPRVSGGPAALGEGGPQQRCGGGAVIDVNLHI
jgi:hypothetical protein